MTKPLPFLLLLASLFLHCNVISAQAPAPAPSGPLNVTAILEKAGQFTSFIRLLKSTQLADQINTQLNNSNQGLTVFAPPDNAFDNMKSGTLNSLSDQQKVQLMQFHVLPTMMSMSQFQTASNPLRTQAGDSNGGEFPLNVTTSGNQVNLTTGVVDATVANTIYTGGNLVVYQVDQVLLPSGLFGTQAPAPAPDSKPEKDTPVATKGSSDDGSAATSDSECLKGEVVTVLLSFGIVVILAIASWA